MQKVRSYIHEFPALWDEPGKCNITVYKDSNLTVFICTEMRENKSGTITTMAEWLATEIWQQEGKPLPFIWFEHYPSELASESVETFHKVTFIHLPNARFFSPQWEVITRKELEVLVGDTDVS